jgi:hypothetical protein
MVDEERRERCEKISRAQGLVEKWVMIEALHSDLAEAEDVLTTSFVE